VPSKKKEKLARNHVKRNGKLILRWSEKEEAKKGPVSDSKNPWQGVGILEGPNLCRNGRTRRMCPPQ